jgi:hypothetical protein
MSPSRDLDTQILCDTGAFPAGCVHVLAPSAASPASPSLPGRLMLGRWLYHRAWKVAATRICPHQIRLRAHQVEAKVPTPAVAPERVIRPTRAGPPGHTGRHRPSGATARQPRRPLAHHRTDHRGDRRRRIYPNRSPSQPVDTTGPPGRPRRTTKNKYQAPRHRRGNRPGLRSEQQRHLQLGPSAEDYCSVRASPQPLPGALSTRRFERASTLRVAPVTWSGRRGGLLTRVAPPVRRRATSGS